jgi:protein-tyrosine phosphatase
MHRTGMIAYVLLRYRGFSEEQALDAIERMRAHTREGLNRERVEWGNALVGAVRGVGDA